VALVTGANKGIGFEVARQLGKAGCTVVIGSPDLSRGYEAAEKLKAENIDARAVELDLSRRETIEAAAARIGSDLQRLTFW
jgi:NAD(P)-dependent dehydrogenase (short-subunit alcohol dehydrogenase family)